MILNEFNVLSLNDKAEVVWNGTFLGDRIEGDYCVQLYSLPDFYVEVFYEVKANKIEDFRPFTDNKGLVPYLAQIKQINMKKTLFFALAVCGALCLISWGLKGHRAVATIAQKHLTSNSAYVVSAYLGGSSMADVSTWADENRDRATAPGIF